MTEFLLIEWRGGGRGGGRVITAASNVFIHSTHGDGSYTVCLSSDDQGCLATLHGCLPLNQALEWLAGDRGCFS